MHEVLHPAFRWITRGAKVTKGYAVKRAGEAPLHVTYPMERDEAAATGLATRLVHDFDHDRIFKSAPNPVAAYGEFFDRVLRDVGSGRSLAFAGNLPIHLYLGVADELGRRGWNVVRSTGDDLVQLARKRKERWEVEAIASCGARTEQVVERVREVLRAAIVEDGHVLHRGEVLTLGHLKQLVSGEIARLGMVEDHDTILSQGRDAAVPHPRRDGRAAGRAGARPCRTRAATPARRCGRRFRSSSTSFRPTARAATSSTPRARSASARSPRSWRRCTRRWWRRSSSRSARWSRARRRARIRRSSATTSRPAATRRRARIPRRLTATSPASDTASASTSTRSRSSASRRRIRMRSRSATSSRSSPASTSPTARSACASRTRSSSAPTAACSRSAAATAAYFPESYFFSAFASVDPLRNSLFL